MFKKEVYIERRNRLREKMSGGLVLLPGNVDAPMNYPDNTYHFRQDSTFLYFFGINKPGLFGVIDVDEGMDMLFGNDVDIDDIIWMGPQPSLKNQAAEVGVKCTNSFNDVYAYVNKALWQGRRVHFVPPYRANNRLLLKGLLGIHTAKLPDYTSLELIKHIVDMRSVKDAYELAEIEKACATGYEMHVTAMKMAKEGASEQKIAGTIEGIALAGGGGVSFPIILSQHGETLHNHDHSLTLKTGKLMLTDAGAETAMGYASDFTRTVPVGGKFTQKQKEVYEIVLAANNEATAMVKPGVRYLDVHLNAARVIASGLKDLGLIKGDVDEAVRHGAHALFMPHGLGHMMGLDVHDMEDYGQIYVGYDEETRPMEQFGTAGLRLGRRLQEGFVLTNEPGIYFIPALIEKWRKDYINTEYINFDKVMEYADFGGIRLEDDLLVTSEGAQILGKRLPITPDEVEETMRG